MLQIAEGLLEVRDERLPRSNLSTSYLFPKTPAIAHQGLAKVCPVHVDDYTLRWRAGMRECDRHLGPYEVSEQSAAFYPLHDDVVKTKICSFFSK